MTRRVGAQCVENALRCEQVDSACVTAGHNKDYTVTVTAVDGGNIIFNYAPTT